MLIRPSFSGSFWVFVDVKKPRPARPEFTWGLGACLAVLVGVGAFFGVDAGLPGLALATHETDHRFTVSGYVRDKEGKPVADVRVGVRDLRDQKVEAVSTFTDGKGFYKTLLHLHNDNVGDPIQVSVKDEKTGLDETVKIRADFNPKDRHTDRQARVDLGLVPASAREGGGLGTSESDGPPAWVYGIGGLVVVGAIGVAVVWSRRRQARQSKGGRKRRGKNR